MTGHFGKGNTSFVALTWVAKGSNVILHNIVLNVVSYDDYFPLVYGSLKS